MTLYRATVLDVPGDPFTDGPDALRAETDAGLLVRDGVITARGPYAELRAAHPGEPVEDLTDGVLLPGFVDTHVHYPQVRVIGGLGMPLLDWLERCALPEEARLADDRYAAAVAEDFLTGLAAAGTTTALVFGAHFATATDVFFAAAERSGLRITAGQVVSDRVLRDELLTDPDRALTEGRRLIERWHGRGRLRYAVTPRFSLSTSDDLLAVCGELLEAADGVAFTSHANENLREVDRVRELFPGSDDYLDTYDKHGLLGPRSVIAHNVHVTDAELDLMARVGAWSSHCPTSNASLGSGLFPLRRHAEHGVGVAMGSDVGGGTGFSLVKEGLQAYFAQQLLGPDGLPLTSTHLLYLITRAGARALGLDDRVGDLGVGKQFDASWLRPSPGSTFATNLAHAEDAADALAKIFTLSTPGDVAAVWVGGDLTTASGGRPRNPSTAPSSRPKEAA
ncbi:guanine deaminase [Friedmanniella endophytica]|uniref:Guanine deaminase n=1 Tax=Microlunatus kandeliicorticis TaxID=1759536 RepID=A0A7W3P6D6_9ACTN|nr:guanine deaminase [Microlunatus kandeliicorticis]MBA8794805.1 guanine deaminase [Microlunatus kandeliicorticis]